MLSSPRTHSLLRFRELPSLLDALKHHVSLFRQYGHNAYILDNKDYISEVLGKIRLLAVRSQSNTPLLIDLMRLFDFKETLKFRGMPFINSSGEENWVDWTLEDYMQSEFTSWQSEDGWKIMSIEAFISLYANKFSSTHEDWTWGIELVKLELDMNSFSSHLADLVSISLQ